jgi:cell division protease FtsH
VPTEKERKILAYHEAGHAVAFALQPDLGEIRKVTIMPRGNAGGFMAPLAKEEMFFSRERYEQQLIVAFGGRVAEKKLTGTISSGASNDLRQATELAKQMVFDLGMGGEEYVAWGSDSGPVFLGGEITRRKDFSEETARQLESQVHGILRRAYEIAEQVIGEHWEAVTAVAEALLIRETLDGQLVKAAVEKALAGQSAQEITAWIVEQATAADRAVEEESRRAVAEAERQRRKALEGERLKPPLEPRPASEG